MRRLAIAALVLATASSLSFAQSPKGQPGMGGMMGGGQGHGMMGGQGQGMMGGGMMNHMGGRMPMMDMMQTMGMMRHGGGACPGGSMGMATIDHVEGRIAFLRTELKITDAQSAVWNAFADALRTNAKNLGEVRASMVAGAAQQDLVERFALQEKWLTARLEGTKAIKAALVNLVGAMSEDQKKSADELLAPHMGMMAMMQPGHMGSGASQPSR